MIRDRVIIRSASESDSRLIVMAFISAVGGVDVVRGFCGERYMDVLEEIVLTEGTQYDYHNALVAEYNGVGIGVVLGYDGGKLLQLRDKTFDIIRKYTGKTPIVDPETESGEFYIDTLAVMPEYRRCGVGRMLLNALCDKVFGMGFARVGLLVDQSNIEAEKLYNSMGFVRCEEKLFLAHPMWHMIKEFVEM